MSESADKIASTLQSTMVGPLWARAKYSQLYPELLKDDQAVDLIEQVKRKHTGSQDDFDVLEEFIDELLGLAFAIRARTFDDTIAAFLQSKPHATIVNLGCGLDTTFSRVDNGTLHWFDLDLPDAIDYRRQLIPETSRSKYIAKSIFDFSWMEDIGFNYADGLLMIAGGLFAYFDEEDVSQFFRTIAQRFPGGEIIFDSSSSRGNWVINRRFRKYGITGIDHKFDAKSPSQIESWSELLDVVDWFPYFSRVRTVPRWGLRTRLIMTLNSNLKLAKFIHVRIKESQP
ncbi:MAG: class I SAM-dependent methyltransferase [Candidatus Thorarchaeota archaeon]